MEQQEMKQYYAQQELRNCGFTPESINAIQSTTVITRDGMQHVVPQSQSHLHQAPTQQPQMQHTQTHHQQAHSSVAQENNNHILQSLQQQLQDQGRMFSRHKQYSDQRIMQLEHQLRKAIEQLKTMSEVVMTLKSNAGANAKAAAIANRTDGKPSTKAVDRNNVAPSEVQVEDIFYSGNRR